MFSQFASLRGSFQSRLPGILSYSTAVRKAAVNDNAVKGTSPTTWRPPRNAVSHTGPKNSLITCLQLARIVSPLETVQDIYDSLHTDYDGKTLLILGKLMRQAHEIAQSLGIQYKNASKLIEVARTLSAADTLPLHRLDGKLLLHNWSPDLAREKRILKRRLRKNHIRNGVVPSIRLISDATPSIIFSWRATAPSTLAKHSGQFTKTIRIDRARLFCHEWTELVKKKRLEDEDLIRRRIAALKHLKSTALVMEHDVKRLCYLVAVKGVNLVVNNIPLLV